MPKKRAKHSAEYKQQALRRVVDREEPVASVADDLGLARETLYSGCENIARIRTKRPQAVSASLLPAIG